MSIGGSMEKRSDGPSRAARRRFLKTVPAAVAAGIAGPALARRAQETQRIDKATLECGERIMGIDFSDAEQQAALSGVNTNLANFERLRGYQIPPEIEPPLTFRPYLPGKKPKAGATPNGRIKIAGSAIPGPRRTSVDDLAFQPVTALSTLVRKREVSSTELTRMYLARLKKHGPALNCVVTLTEDLALGQAAQADKEIKAGRYRGPLHGIPWGAKDLFATKGILTTWGAAPYQNQVFDYDATVVERLRDAGAVLAAKLSLGALAQGDNWFRGQTKNPWNGRGSSGSSAGPGSATAAGLVGFSLGTETRGSIISPSAVNGVVGLRPTYGRVSRHGAMALSWTMDKIGPMCRSVEDCALVFNAIYGPDGRDDSVIDAPFEWNPDVPLSKLRIGYVKTEFELQPADGRGGRGDAGGRGRGGLTPEQQRAQDEARLKILNEVLEVYRKAGAAIQPIDVPGLDITAALNFILSVEAAAAFDDLTRSKDISDPSLNTWPNTFRTSRYVPAVEYIRAQRARAVVMREMDKLMSQYDAFISPTGSRSLSLTNLTGHPAIALRAGFLEDAPVDFMITGRLYDEGTLMRVALAHEQATKWHERVPSL
ncbi:MAG TPA: amidase [Vicinamibacterales bacterium]|nr:amidase [Vicinamibacterales bacterium]